MSIQTPHLRPPPPFNSGLLKDYWGPGWYGNSNYGWIVCYGIDHNSEPVDNATWYESRQEAEDSLVRSNITTKGGNRKRGYSRRRRGDKRKSRRGGKKLKLKMRL
jgi:hypothetical protein